MMAVMVEGDSLAVGMEPYVRNGAHVRFYDAKGGRTTHEGVQRLLARKRGDGGIVFISLGTNDTGWYPGSTKRTSAMMQRSARRVLRHARCVVWGLVRIDRPSADQRAVRAVNRGLRRAAAENGRLHLVKAVRPNAPDQIHMTASGYERRAKRFLSVAREHCA